MILTCVDPVKATLSTSVWFAMAAPAVGPYPGTMLITPGGNPAWKIKAFNGLFEYQKKTNCSKLLCGVFSEGHPSSYS